MKKRVLPLLGITAYSGTGKTTLLKKLIPLLQQANIKVALIKHSHHDMDIDIPGKDSYELRKAGATQTIVACDRRWALMTETTNQPVDLACLAERLDPTQLDLILVEGFKHEPIAKIALFREQIGKPFANLIDHHVIAIASDIPLATTVPLLDINDPTAISQFIVKWLTPQIS